MLRYLKEIIILVIQLLMFYLFPLVADRFGPIGMVILIVVSVFVLSFILGLISKERLKVVYPILISVLFIPSVYIYYNDSALIHTLWYFVLSTIGLICGIVARRMIRNKFRKEKK